MTDIVERLRDTVQILATTQMNLSMEDWDKVSNAVLDAAGAIKRLRDDNGELTRRETEAAAEIDRLRAALQHAPLEPGSFVGDIFYGNPDYTTLGTHRWDGAQWVALPSVEEALTRLLAEARAENKHLKAAMQWRPISEAPKDGTRMLLAYRNSLQKWRRVIGFYAPKLTIEQNDDGDGWCEYDEANDRYCLPVGWYECIDNWDDYSYVHIGENTPTHWMPLPPPPKGAEE